MEPKPNRSITLDQVNSNNTNLFRYDQELAKALHRCRFTPSRPQEYNHYCEAAGIVGYTDPVEALEMRLDLEVFISELEQRDKLLLQGLAEGVTQSEIGRRVGRSQPWVSMRLSELRERLRAYYMEDGDEY